jgi:hypothetical protein
VAGPVLTPDRPATVTTAARERRTPAVVQPGRNLAARRTVRTQWLVLAAALTILAGVVVAWALGRAADRVNVVSIARPVAAGATITRDDLTVTAIAFDQPIDGLVPAEAIDELVGRSATITLRPGALISVGMWTDGTELAAGERTVGAVLAPGRFPSGLAAGSAAAAMDADDPTRQIDVRVLDAHRTDSGDLELTLAVGEADAATVAHLAATGNLVVVGLPATPEAGSDT